MPEEWRTAFNIMLYPLLAIGAYTIWNSARFEEQLVPIRQELIQSAMTELAPAYAGEISVTDAGSNPEKVDSLRKHHPRQAALLEELGKGETSFAAPALETRRPISKMFTHCTGKGSWNGTPRR